MLEELRNAWHEAVRNFRRELHAEDRDGPAPASARTGHGVHATIMAAERELRRLEDELSQTRRQLDEERTAADRCRRRESLARGIGHVETAVRGARFAARHAEKAELLERKADVLTAEHELREREMAEMRAALAARRGAARENDDGRAVRDALASLEEDLRGDAEFR
jgi:hypothetical protein